MKKIKLIVVCVFIFTTLFTFGNSVTLADDIGERVKPTSLTRTILKTLFGVDKLKSIGLYISESFVSMALPCGDSFLHMICLAVKEPVTIDAAVYDNLKKVDINFFDSSSGESDSDLASPLKNVLHDVVNTWYGVFTRLAILAYVVIFVYLGIKILLTSTAEKKANYKSILTAWVTGVAMLFLFPYVMKYAIDLNHVLCQWIAKETGATEVDKNADVSNIGIMGAFLKYGKDDFVMMMLGREYGSEEEMARAVQGDDNYFGSNNMMRIRYLAGYKLSLPLTVVYFILIGQLLAVLIMYYKRVFMIAFLITIFPLVVIFYPLNKIGDVKLNSFGIWFKEFLVNVFVQSFHAVTYTVIVMIGVNSYIESNGTEWLFMIICTLFLFEGEKIIRAIFNAKSSISSIGDMAASGAMAFAVAKKVGGLFKGKDKDGDEDNSDEDAKDKALNDRRKAGAARRNASNPTPGAANNMAAAAGAGGGTASGDTGAGGPGAGATNSAEGYEPMAPEDVFNSGMGAFENRAKNKKINTVGRGVGHALSGVSKATGATVGFTYGMAQRDSSKGMETAVGAAVTGYGIGGEIGKGAKAITEGIAGKVAKHQVASAIVEDGFTDEELGITEADRQLDAAKAKVYSDIMNKIAREGGLHNRAKAEIKFIKEVLDRTDNS